MRTFRVFFTVWSDEEHAFVEKDGMISVKNKTFAEMFNKLMAEYNAYCSDMCYDINWINSIQEIKDVA